MKKLFFALCLLSLLGLPGWAADAPVNKHLLKEMKVGFGLMGLDFSPDGKRLVVCGLNRDVLVWDYETAKVVLTLKGHTDDVVTVRYSPDGRFIASGGVDHAVILWDAQTGQLIRKSIDHIDYVRDVAFSPNSELLASAGWDGQAMVYETLGGRRVAALRASTATAVLGPGQGFDQAKTNSRAGNVTAVAFRPDGKQLLTASGDKLLRLWDTSTWKMEAKLTGHNDEIWDARYSPNGRYAVSGAWDNTARIWDLETRRVIRTIPAHVSDVWSVMFSPDGQLIATGGGDRRVLLWDAATGTLVQDVGGESNGAEVKRIVFSPDGKLLASVSQDGGLRVYDVPTAEDRIAAYADYEIDKWVRKGEFEKQEDYAKRLTKRYARLQELRTLASERLLEGFGMFADWEKFNLGIYDAETETYSLTSSTWPGLFRLKVPLKEAPLLRETFQQVQFRKPMLEMQLGQVVFQQADVVAPLGVNGTERIYQLQR